MKEWSDIYLAKESIAAIEKDNFISLLEHANVVESKNGLLHIVADKTIIDKVKEDLRRFDSLIESQIHSDNK